MGISQLSAHSLHSFTGHTDIEEDVDIDGQIETLHTPSQYNATAATFRHDFDRVSQVLFTLLDDFDMELNT